MGTDSSAMDDARRLVEAQADVVAEALIMHTHDCVTRKVALCLLKTAGMHEAGFLRLWKDGELDV